MDWSTTTKGSKLYIASLLGLKFNFMPITNLFYPEMSTCKMVSPEILWLPGNAKYDYVAG